MEYTVEKLATLAGVSPRTLRYYDQIGLLRPRRAPSSSYRIYGPKEVDRLQQILLYRNMGLPLADIAAALDGPGFSRLASLQRHLAALKAQQAQTALMIQTVEKTIQHEKGIKNMTDKEKFEGFKEKLIQQNEEQYGQEIREKYGEEAVAASNARMMSMTQQQYDAMEQLSQSIQQLLEDAVRTKADPHGPQGKQVAALHKEWLAYTWKDYSPEAHRGLVQMYVEDDRFTAYYDKNLAGCAAFLRDAVQHWLEG